MLRWWWNGSKNLQPNGQSQPRCSNFTEIERAVREARSRGRRDTDFMKLHASYSDLEHCAHNKCRGCRVVRQALLLSQITREEVERLEKRDGPVYVRLLGGDSSAESISHQQPTLQVRLGVSHESAILGNQSSDRQGDGADDCEGNDCQACSNDGGEDWDAEASRMHVIYGNAVFTLCACSSTSSRDRLLWDRKAWAYRVVPFYFEGQWLVNYDMSLNEVRATAPLSKRAWTLQEERLSPRLVYYCGQRVYWSCLEKQHTETAARSAAKHNLGSRPFEREDGFKKMSEAQIFINYSFAVERVRLHQDWKDLVDAYCPRAWTKPTDRLPAISGLAALYLSTYITQDNKILQQEYLAGLWRDTFAEDLAWSVRTGADPCNALAEIAPSWSWASLPAMTHVSMKEDFKQSNDFELLEASEERMRGRLRQVMNCDSENVDWSEITTGRGGKNKYDLSKNIARHVHARNKYNGQIVIYEPNKQPIEGKLDYLLPLNANINSDSREIHVAAGMEWDLYGLQIGQKTMLLVQFSRRREPGTDSNTRSDTWVTVFRRVGICRNVREAFFEGAELVDLELE
ncbi:uncharacterized protein Z519_08446 [Cladophialophora bantiana CBS 173.52]|uniref:Heterokaryon incompatibility domain-containing protein n=1 Tax=Cladophialophora bantiana (strain ATCC 10958 / CBS 173.52 / CDC B-1940 / NIH 8579) TaxID=1442370 RepID=A0A0D2HBM5_CLAB1|nr:uncharacterized protein Z519_08446 [Cladophialophora bantiana CBS 173.52]KIW90663.1 hypothetical protein Z519_08446 [Cladophialophora bantiana CBS 173.52]